MSQYIDDALPGVLTPTQVYAAWQRDLLSYRKLEHICMEWLEQGLGGTEIAVLAFAPSDEELKENLPAALKEVSARTDLSNQEIDWLNMRLLLQITAASNDPYDACHRVVCYHKNRLCGEKDLFDRSDLDRKYAAQEAGIERLYGLYYSPDDFINWTAEQQKELETEIVLESREILKKFYSRDSNIPSNYKELIET